MLSGDAGILPAPEAPAELAPGLPSTAPWPMLREELQIHDAGANRDGSPAWHVCDPVRNLFFRIGWLEFEILRRWQLADPQAIAEDIERSTTLAPEAEDVAQFSQFLMQHQLLRLARRKPDTPWWRWLLNNYLFIRIPLVRPAQRLASLLPWVRWLFSRWFLGATAVAALAGIVLAARQLDLVEANLRGALSWEGVVGFAGALVVSKLLHELGHALVSTRHGVRVGHMGVALLVMWPMPYTDTGESWKLARSRHRFAIASAGIGAELVLAAWSTLLWTFLPEGNFRNALFFLATTAWVLTLAVNASPFMRFDGYYMLTDALDFPGLHERAGHQARRALRRWLPGLHEPATEVLTPGFRRFLIGFAFATWIYRLVLFVGIAVVVYHAFFKALGVLLFVVELAVFVVRPVQAELRVWARRRREIPVRRLVVAALLLAGAAAFLLVPWSAGVSAAGVLKAASEQPVYAPFAARLEGVAIRNGTRVEPGGALVELDAPAQAEERDKARALSAAYARSARGALGLPEDGAARSVVAEQLSQRYEAEGRAREAELQRLRLVAARGGALRDVDPDLRPGTWVGPSQLIGMVVDGRRWRVEALVTERDRRRLAVGSPAVVIVRGHTRKLEGTVAAIDGSPAARLPHLLLAQEHGGPIPLNPTQPKKELRPAEAWFRVLVEGEDSQPVEAVREVRVHFDATRESLALGWIHGALSVLIQQSGL
ncbi:MAG: HlyD family efflux transporter periplasmic adaptor subunit [Comamonadaceae bacterium]|nr:MAG: HlyD family efflux transporter periplasmic adaptor subunit [Comamonadaceae bacterium]